MAGKVKRFGKLKPGRILGKIVEVKEAHGS
jgi:hypothetical protein